MYQPFNRRPDYIRYFIFISPPEMPVFEDVK